MIVLCSLWGAPGVTRSSYALAHELKRLGNKHVLIAECDESGGDIAVWLNRSSKPGMGSLAATARRGLSQEDLWEHVQESPEGVGILCGIASAEHAPVLKSAIDQIATILSQVGQIEVVVDLGRLQPGIGTSQRFIELADHIIVCARPESGYLVHTSQRLPFIMQINPRVSLLLLGSGPYPRSNVEREVGVPIIGQIENIDSDNNLWRSDQIAGSYRPNTQEFKIARRKSNLQSGFEKIAKAIINDRIDSTPVLRSDPGEYTTQVQRSDPGGYFTPPQRSEPGNYSNSKRSLIKSLSTKDITGRCIMDTRQPSESDELLGNVATGS